MTKEQEKLLTEEFANAFENMDFDSFKSYVDTLEVNDDSSFMVDSYLDDLMLKGVRESDVIDDRIQKIVCLYNKFGEDLNGDHRNFKELIETVEDEMFEPSYEKPKFNVFLFRLAATFGGQEAVEHWFSHLFDDKELLYSVWGFTQESTFEKLDYAATLYCNPCWDDDSALPIADIAAECMRFVDDDSRPKMWRKVISFGDDFHDPSINHNTAKDILRFYLSTGYPCLNEEMLKQAKRIADAEGLSKSYGLFEVLLNNGYEPTFDTLLGICKRSLSERKSKKKALECLEKLAAIMPYRGNEINALTDKTPNTNIKANSKKRKRKSTSWIRKFLMHNFRFIILMIMVLLIICGVLIYFAV